MVIPQAEKLATMEHTMDQWLRMPDLTRRYRENTYVKTSVDATLWLYFAIGQRLTGEELKQYQDRFDERAERLKAATQQI